MVPTPSRSSKYGNVCMPPVYTHRYTWGVRRECGVNRRRRVTNRRKVGRAEARERDEALELEILCAYVRINLHTYAYGYTGARERDEALDLEILYTHIQTDRHTHTRTHTHHNTQVRVDGICDGPRAPDS